MPLLFIDTYADLAVRLDANVQDEVDDDAAIEALMAGAEEARAQAPSAPSAGRPKSASPSGRPKSASPKSKGRKKVVLVDNVSGVQTCVLPETAGQNLEPDVVLELEESEIANKRGHVLIAIENPNPALDIKILVRDGGGGWSWSWSLQLLTLLLTCVVFWFSKD